MIHPSLLTLLLSNHELAKVAHLAVGALTWRIVLFTQRQSCTMF
jgi:hypothetical protein